MSAPAADLLALAVALGLVLVAADAAGLLMRTVLRWLDEERKD